MNLPVCIAFCLDSTFVSSATGSTSWVLSLRPYAIMQSNKWNWSDFIIINWWQTEDCTSRSSVVQGIKSTESTLFIGVELLHVLPRPHPHFIATQEIPTEHTSHNNCITNTRILKRKANSSSRWAQLQTVCQVMHRTHTCSIFRH